MKKWRVSEKAFNRRNSIIALAIISVLSILSAFQISKLSFSYDIETFFSPHDPELRYYQQYRDDFENDNAIILLAIESEQGVFNTDFLVRLAELTSKLQALDQLEFVTSPTGMERYLMSPLGIPFRMPLISMDDPERLGADSARIFSERIYLNSFFAEDGKSVSLLLKSQSHISDDVHEGLLNEVKSLLTEHEFTDYHLGGRIIVENYYVKLIKRELVLFSLITLIVMIGFLWFIYKSPLGVVFPLAVIVVAGLLTMALVQVTGGSISLMLTMLPTILFVVCIGDSVHVLNKFIYEIRQGRDKSAAIWMALKEVGLATFLTSLTTAVGFASLSFISIPPLQEFGMYVAMGVMLTFFITVLLLPALLFLAPGSDKFGKHEDTFDWPSRMGHLYGFVMRRRKWVITITILFMAFLIAGIPKIRVNYYFLDDLNEQSVLKHDMKFFEEHYSGIRALELGLKTKDSTMTLFDSPVLEELSKVEDFLLNDYKVGFLWSPLNIVKLTNQALHAGNADYYALPENTGLIKKALRSGKLDVTSGLGQSFWTSDLRTGRFSGRIHDIGSAETEALDQQLMSFIQENTNLVDYQLTGSMHLVDNNNRHLSINMLKGLAISLLVVSFAVFLMFRNARMAFVALIPNIIPLLIVAGLMGWIGIDLKVPTAIIFTIAFGVAVDNTLHILSRLRIELGKGKQNVEAIHHAYLHTGKSVVLTAIILIIGFLSFAFSESRATFTVGLMISVTLFVALWADLVILPLLMKRYLK